MSNDNIYSTQVPPPNPPADNRFSNPNQYNASQNQNSGRFTPPPTQPIYYQPERRSGCGTFLLRTAGVVAVLLVLAFIGLFFLGTMVAAMLTSMEQVSIAAGEKSLTEKFVLGDKTSSSKIAVINVDGMIVGGDDTYVAKQIKAVLNDADVKAVVLRIESPGGTMSGSDYYYYLLKKIKRERNIPIVVSMGTIAASGGYYIAMVGDEIFAEHSTITGSIGVIYSLYNGAELLKKVGVESDPIVSGPHKTMGSFSKAPTPEERAMMQAMVDDSFGRFKTVIKEGRKNFAAAPDELDKLATGRVFTASEARENGLIDEIGFLEDAVDKAMVLAGVTENNCKVIKYKPKLDFIETLLEAKSPKQPFSAETITGLTTPKLMMLCPYTVPVEP